jgi:hypothetical protein
LLGRLAALPWLRLWLTALLRRDALPLLGRRLYGLPGLWLTALLRRLAALPRLGLSTLRWAFLLRRLFSFWLAFLARIVGIAARLALREDDGALTEAIGSGAPLRESQRRQHGAGQQHVA